MLAATRGDPTLRLAELLSISHVRLRARPKGKDAASTNPSTAIPPLVWLFADRGRRRLP